MEMEVVDLLLLLLLPLANSKLLQLLLSLIEFVFPIIQIFAIPVGSTTRLATSISPANPARRTDNRAGLGDPVPFGDGRERPRSADHSAAMGHRAGKNPSRGDGRLRAPRGPDVVPARRVVV